MAKQFFRWILKQTGWKSTHAHPVDLKRFVLIIAPHTSMWDFVWGKLFVAALGYKVKFLIKKEVFWFPLGLLIRALGGLPVNRNRGNQMIHQVVEAFEKHEELVVVITPEGTRAATTHWKKGFYHIALKAGVPVAVGYLDYPTRTYGVVFTFMPTGDFKKDFEPIAALYRSKTGKHPDRFALPA